MAVQSRQKGFEENAELCNLSDGKPWKEYTECDKEVIQPIGRKFLEAGSEERNDGDDREKIQGFSTGTIARKTENNQRNGKNGFCQEEIHG